MIKADPVRLKLDHDAKSIVLDGLIIGQDDRFETLLGRLEESPVFSLMGDRYTNGRYASARAQRSVGEIELYVLSYLDHVTFISVYVGPGFMDWRPETVERYLDWFRGAVPDFGNRDTWIRVLVQKELHSGMPLVGINFNENDPSRIAIQ